MRGNVNVASNLQSGVRVGDADPDVDARATVHVADAAKYQAVAVLGEGTASNRGGVHDASRCPGACAQECIVVADRDVFSSAVPEEGIVTAGSEQPALLPK